jgi:hypothetical protein
LDAACAVFSSPLWGGWPGGAVFLKGTPPPHERERAVFKRI